MNNKCCGKEMIELSIASIDRTILDEKQFICGECGNIKDYIVRSGLMENTEEYKDFCCWNEETQKPYSKISIGIGRFMCNGCGGKFNG